MRVVLSPFAPALLLATVLGAQQRTDLPTPDARNQTVDPQLYAHLQWRCIGPTRGGRVTTVAGVTQQPNTFYMGASGGGVWKTTDYGKTWNNVSDGYFATGSIGAIRVAPSNPDIVWVGTGSDGLRSNVITGRGIYRSTDAGKTWQFMGLRDVGQIGAVEIHPTDPDVVHVAAIGNAFKANPERGVYRTRDGGKTWDKVLFVSDTCGAVDLELNTADPDEIYASMWRGERKPWTIISGAEEGGIYKSTDGGDSWQKLTAGLPQGLFGKSDLAVSRAAPGRVLALIEAPAPDGGLYRSDDGGETFELISTQRGLLDRPFYYCNVDMDPRDADVVWVNSTGCYRSEDGGERFGRVRTPHGDNHDVWINPENSDILIQCNDGGANVSTDGGKTWSTQRNQPTAELYQVALDDAFPYRAYAGQQDNSTVRVPSNTLSRGFRRGGAEEDTANWESVGGCETGPVIPKPGDPDIVYAGCKGKLGIYNARTGQEQSYWIGAANMYGHNPADLKYRFQRVFPIHVSPHDPDTVYQCSQFVHRTTDEGRTWDTISPDLTAFPPHAQVASGTPITRDITGEEHYSVLYAFEESPLKPGVLWAGANDGPIHVSRDGGKSWANVTPPDLPPGGRVKTIAPSPHDAGKCYVAVYRFLLGDFQPYIYRFDDYGASWQRLTTGDNGIPSDTPTRVVREDPDREGLLYAGTDFGMFVSFDDGKHWQSLQNNLPVTPVTGIAMRHDDVVISTMGRSFWVLDDVSTLQQLDPDVAAAPFHLFTPRPAYRIRNGRTGPTDRVPASYPLGARIDYRLASAPDGDIELAILDGDKVIATFTSGQPATTDTAEASTPQRGGRGDPMMAGRGGFRRGGGRGRAAPVRLEKTTGVHSVRWDLQAQGAGGSSRFRRGGTMVPPGIYHARLRVGDEEQTVPVEVLIDPRLAAEGVTADDLRAQAAFLAEVGDLSSRASALSRKIVERERTLRQRVEAGGSDAEAAEKAIEALMPLKNRVVNRRDQAYAQPMLTSQIGYLRGMVSRADQHPGDHALMRLADLEKEYAACLAAFEALAAVGGK